VRITEGSKAPKIGYFSAFLRQDGFKRGQPIFVREEYPLGPESMFSSPGVRSLVVVGRAALHAAGDAKTLRIRNRQPIPRISRQVRLWSASHCLCEGLVSNVIGALSSLDTEADRSLYADIFSVPADARKTRRLPSDVSGHKKGSKARRPTLQSSLTLSIQDFPCAADSEYFPVRRPSRRRPAHR